MTPDEIKAGLENVRDDYKAWLAEDVQQTIAGLELLADERITLVHCPKCDPEDYNNPADDHCEECPRVLAANALALLRQRLGVVPK